MTQEQTQLPRLSTQEGIMYLRSAESGDLSSAGPQSDPLALALSSAPSSVGSNDRATSHDHRVNFPGLRYADGRESVVDDLVTPCQGLLPPQHHSQDHQNASTAGWETGEPSSQSFSFMLAHATHPSLKRGMVPSLDSYSIGSASEEFKPAPRPRRETAPSGELSTHFMCSDFSRPPTGSAQNSDGGESSLLSGSIYSTGGGPNGPNRATSAGASSIHKKTQYHKTKLCPWHKENKCFMGKECNYAHTREELKPKPDLSKTKLCPEITRNKQCDRPGCRFAHDFVELRATSTFFKTRICKYWQRGNCPAGSDCRHAHGKEDLRADPAPQQISAPPSASTIQRKLGSASGISVTASSSDANISEDGLRPEVSANRSHTNLPAGSVNRPPLQSDASQDEEKPYHSDIFSAQSFLTGKSESGERLSSSKPFGLIRDPVDNCIGPIASALPSPSFLPTTASTPLPQADLSVFLKNRKITECAESIVSGHGDQEAMQRDFVALIQEEVDRQWKMKLSDLSAGWQQPTMTKLGGICEGDSTPGGEESGGFEASRYLPPFIVQKLQAGTPIKGCRELPETSEADLWAGSSPCGSPSAALIEAALGQLLGWSSSPLKEQEGPNRA